MVAQSIFSHTGLDLLVQWLEQIHYHLNDDGFFFATFISDESEDFTGSGWVYPECVSFKTGTLLNITKKAGFEMEFIDWFHPRQKWTMLKKIV